MEMMLTGFRTLGLFLAKGGVLMLPIALCSVIAVALMIERLWYYRQTGGHPQHLFEQIAGLIRQRRFEQALQQCQGASGIFARLFAQILANRQRPVADIEKLVSMTGTREIQNLSRHVRGLGMIGNLTPLLGLLGTVVGMVKTFMKIADASGQVNPSLLAGGIWEALLTTAAGLTVAIPVVMMHHYCEGVTERLAMQMKSYSIECLDLITREAADDRI